MGNVPEFCAVSYKVGAYPRVLIVNGEPLHRRSATGITLCNLFNGWPAANLAQVYTAGYAPETEFGTNTTRLTPSDLVPFSWWRNEDRSESAHDPASVGSRLQQDPRAPLMRRYISPALELLPYRMPPMHIARLDEFKPDLIYSNLASIRIARLVRWLGKALRVPVVPHFMDDWLATYAVPGRSIGTPAHSAILNRQVRSIMRAAPLGLAIGQAMADEYAQCFAKPFHPFMNTAYVPEAPDAPRHFTPPLRLVYVGGLHLGRCESLAVVARSLCNAARPPVAELHIYAPDVDRDRGIALAAIGRHVKFKGSVSAANVTEILRESDVLLHVESFQPDVVRFTRLSVSTKIPQYLAAARPIIAFGPGDLASIKYVAQSGGGLSASHPAELERALQTVINDPQARIRLGAIGWRHAHAHHEAAAVRRRFREVLTSAAEGGCIHVVR